MNTELKKAKLKYAKICEELEILNEQAYSLELHILYLQSKERTEETE